MISVGGWQFGLCMAGAVTIGMFIGIAIMCHAINRVGRNR